MISIVVPYVYDSNFEPPLFTLILFLFFNPAFMMEWFAVAMVMSIYVKILIVMVVTPTSLEVSRNDNLTLEVI